MLTDDDLHGADASTKRFLQSFHTATPIDANPVDQATTLNAGVQYLKGRTLADAYIKNPRIGADRDALDYGRDVTAAVNAVGAPNGSIAAREDPFRYGSIASRQFGSTFTPGATDQLNDFASQGDANSGLARRSLYKSLTGGG